MSKQTVDFNHIEPRHQRVHDRLRNWAAWVTVRPASRVSPMFRMYRPAQHWEPKEFRQTCDTQDAALVEKLVATLPPDHAFALRWAYVWRMSVGDARRAIGVSSAGLQRYLRDGREMILNLGE